MKRLEIRIEAITDKTEDEVRERFKSVMNEMFPASALIEVRDVRCRDIGYLGTLTGW